MAGIDRYRVRAASPDGMGDSVQGIGLSALETFNARRLTCCRVGPCDTREPEHVVKGSILKHEDEDMFEPRGAVITDNTIEARAVVRGRQGRRLASMITNLSFSGGCGLLWRRG